MLPRQQLAALGFAGILYANAAMQAAMLAMQQTLEHLHSTGSLVGIENTILGFGERQAIVKHSPWSALESRYTISR